MTDKRVLMIGKVFNRPSAGKIIQQEEVFNPAESLVKMIVPDPNRPEHMTYMEVRNGKCTLKPM